MDQNWKMLPLWKDHQGVLEDPEFFTGRGQEVFNAELLGTAQTLQLARNIGGRTLVLLDSQAVISRLQGRQFAKIKTYYNPERKNSYLRESDPWLKRQGPMEQSHDVRYTLAASGLVPSRP